MAFYSTSSANKKHFSRARTDYGFYQDAQNAIIDSKEKANMNDPSTNSKNENDLANMSKERIALLLKEEQAR